MKSSTMGSIAVWMLASAILVSSLFPHYTSMPHTLGARQSRSCPTSYKSLNGLRFTTYCDYNNPHNDAELPFETETMEICLEHCSRYWGASEGCFGVVWGDSGKRCWIRNSTTSTFNMYEEERTHSALLASRDDLAPLDTKCPEQDLSSHAVPGVTGVEYKVHCGKVINERYDTDWAGYPANYDYPYEGFYHANNLEECIQHCINEQPLCRGVSFNPGFELGYANCWPKTGFEDGIDDPPTDWGIMHSATIAYTEPVEEDCPKDDQYKSSNDSSKVFGISCGHGYAGFDITSIHSANLPSCIDACAASNEGCVGVVFDTTMENGYNNCYLKNTTTIANTQPSSHLALLSNAPNPSDPESPSPPPQTKSATPSSAWIAGPVIGGLAGLAIIAFGILWWRRRKGKAGDEPSRPEPNSGGHSYDAMKYRHEHYEPPSELTGDGPSIEPPGKWTPSHSGRVVSELPGNKSDLKGNKAYAPQEFL